MLNNCANLCSCSFTSTLLYLASILMLTNSFSDTSSNAAEDGFSGTQMPNDKTH